LTAIHLHSNKTAELEANGNIQSVYIFGAIAAFILLIACVNSMNLSTARSANRAKEVGIRKVMGSLRSSLISQFTLESVLISFIAMLNYIRNRELGFNRGEGLFDGFHGRDRK
jgi:putative ABC transport system permease protein